MPLYQSLTDRLKNQPEAINQIISLTDHDRVNLVIENKWSIHDNIAHLAKYQPVFMQRIEAILNTDEPGFGRYTAEEDPEFEIWRKWSTEKLSGRLNTDREKIFNLITGLNEEQIIRKGKHPRFGSLTIVQWTEFFLLHEAHHAFTIFQIANNI